MHNREADSGDSGGPWFYGNTAYGIHSGYKSIWGFTRDVFTPVHTNLLFGLNIVLILG